MYAAMILFSVAGIYYHYRIGAALRFAKGQCQTFKATIDKAPRKAAPVEIHATPATPVTSTEEDEHAAHVFESDPSI